MAMRSAVGGARTSIEPGAFGWGVAVAAVLRHSTLPWREVLDAVPLAALPPLGGRDRLSLVAQFAAHQALLQFAGVADGAGGGPGGGGGEGGRAAARRARSPLARGAVRGASGAAAIRRRCGWRVRRRGVGGRAAARRRRAAR